MFTRAQLVITCVMMAIIMACMIAGFVFPTWIVISYVVKATFDGKQETYKIALAFGMVRTCDYENSFSSCDFTRTFCNKDADTHNDDECTKQAAALGAACVAVLLAGVLMLVTFYQAVRFSAQGKTISRLCLQFGNLGLSVTLFSTCVLWNFVFNDVKSERHKWESDDLKALEDEFNKDGFSNPSASYEGTKIGFAFAFPIIAAFLSIFLISFHCCALCRNRKEGSSRVNVNAPNDDDEDAALISAK